MSKREKMISDDKAEFEAISDEEMKNQTEVSVKMLELIDSYGFDCVADSISRLLVSAAFASETNRVKYDFENLGSIDIKSYNPTSNSDITIH